MVDVVRGMGISPVMKTGATASPPRKLGFLQYKDVFFSQQSYRAQLTHFLSNINDAKPLVLSYGHPDMDSFWNKLAPARHRDVLVLTPVRPQPSSNDTLQTEAVAVDQDSEEENLLGTRRYILHNQVEPPPPEPDQLKLENLAGDKLEPAIAFQLSEAYKHLNLPAETPSWVSEHNQQVSIIQATHPSQAGFQRTEHKVISALLKTLAHIAAPLFGLKIENNAVKLPNGQSFSMEKATWRNPEGQTVQIYQVRGLPDGSWLKLTHTPTEALLPLNNMKSIRHQVAHQVEPWEKAGRVRDIPHVAGTPAVFTPVMASTPEANPFNTLSAVMTPETAETFLY